MTRIVTALMLVMMLAPIVLVVWMSFTPLAFFVLPISQWSLRWYRAALVYPGFTDGFVLSTELAAMAAAASVTCAFLASYGLARYPLPGKTALLAFFTSPLLVPAVVFGIAALQFVNHMGLYNRLIGLVLAHMVVVTPYAIRTLHTALATVPEEMEWAAMALGAPRLRMLLSITVPLCARGLITSFLFCFLLSFSEVTMTIFMTGPSYQTLPIRIYSYMSDRIDPMVASVSSMVIFVSLLVVFALTALQGLRRVLR
jgi:putative spermidine/putrescine transport system permease protein